MSMYDKNHYNTVISLQLIKIKIKRREKQQQQQKNKVCVSEEVIHGKCIQVRVPCKKRLDSNLRSSTWLAEERTVWKRDAGEGLGVEGGLASLPLWQLPRFHWLQESLKSFLPKAWAGMMEAVRFK